ncbi:lung adenoma susceptibility protein 2 isoform X2 [Phyllopteryx taeniolatus]|uniref:lung adenoma susceptibility protein 2 isoform X2 n=1 Tax=Phyllopteryx taeniolatus TaxID=161469 RepID=UPI002AD1E87B|nr:lung adenoma susceptibility protein 2 isoform X2 [Phyllopteryx taeniolatus]
MDSTSPGSDFVSPESTVTTLLSSSGHFRTRLVTPEFNSTFRYREKEYDSASAALDAYIADFDRCLHTESSGTLGLALPPNPLSTPRRPRMSTPRNKAALRERLTDREVDFLTLPVSSLRHRDNHDRLSMTTDELLSIPRDGSMPVTHTTAFIRGCPSQSAASQARVSSEPGYRARDNISHSHLSRKCSSSRCNREPEVSTLKQDVPFVRCLTCAHRAARSEQVLRSPSPRLPRRLRGNEADVGRTGTGNVPAWIRDREPLPPSEVYVCDKLGVVPSEGPRTRAPSWLGDTKDDAAMTPNQGDTQQTLRDLRLQLAEQISLIASDRESSHFSEFLWKDNRLESLIQKADQVLNSLSQSFGGADSLAGSVRSDSVNPVNGEEMQLSSISQGPLLPIDLTGAAQGITEALSEQTTQDRSHDGSGIWKQPGPLEALKQMMFRMQAVEAELHRQHKPPIVPTGNKETHRRPESEAEQSLSGAPSLQSFHPQGSASPQSPEAAVGGTERKA